ncbi:MAG: hypothetical protein HC915_18860, partial [Anaerolineae bacterium]|nr:hypothetical protein [Anaerolineae bacterium]
MSQQPNRDDLDKLRQSLVLGEAEASPPHAHQNPPGQPRSAPHARWKPRP